LLIIITAWADGTAVILSVGAKEVKTARKYQDDKWLNSTVQLEEANSGGMIATLEMFHQLHCLIRKDVSIIMNFTNV
jgi:hypothetical protein